MIFTRQRQKASVARLGSYSDNKSSRTNVGVIYGAFKPNSDNNDVIALKITGQAYKFTVEASSNVQIRDALTIDGEKYLVRGIRPYKVGSVKQKVCFIEKDNAS